MKKLEENLTFFYISRDKIVICNNFKMCKNGKNKHCISYEKFNDFYTIVNTVLYGILYLGVGVGVNQTYKQLN